MDPKEWTYDLDIHRGSSEYITTITSESVSTKINTGLSDVVNLDLMVEYEVVSVSWYY